MYSYVQAGDRTSPGRVPGQEVWGRDPQQDSPGRVPGQEVWGRDPQQDSPGRVPGEGPSWSPSVLSCVIDERVLTAPAEGQQNPEVASRNTFLYYYYY